MKKSVIVVVIVLFLIAAHVSTRMDRWNRLRHIVIVTIFITLYANMLTSVGTGNAVHV
jgi:hypothetical protein